MIWTIKTLIPLGNNTREFDPGALIPRVFIIGALILRGIHLYGH